MTTPRVVQSPGDSVEAMDAIMDYIRFLQSHYSRNYYEMPLHYKIFYGIVDAALDPLFNTSDAEASLEASAEKAIEFFRIHGNLLTYKYCQKIQQMLSQTAALKLNFDYEKVKSAFTKTVGTAFMAQLAKVHDENLQNEENKINNEDKAKEYLLKYFEQLPAFVTGVKTDKLDDINAVDEKGRTQLSWAAYFGAEKLVENYLLAGANPNIKDTILTTPFLRACTYGHASVVNQLINAKADCATTHFARSGLWLSTRQGHVGVVEVLLKQTQMDFEKENLGDILRHVIVNCEREKNVNYAHYQKIFNLLMSQNIKNDILNHALVALIEVNTDVDVLFAQLVAAKADVNFQFKQHEQSHSVLELATKYKNLSLIKGLLEGEAHIRQPKQLYEFLMSFKPRGSIGTFFSGTVYADKLESQGGYTMLHACLLALRDGSKSFLTEQENSSLTQFIEEINLKHKSICDKVAEATALPSELLSLVDAYVSPHEHKIYPGKK